MASAPLQLAGPLYDWSTEPPVDLVSFDELHQRVVHHKPGGFSTVDIVQDTKDSSAPDGLFVKLEVEQLRLVRFSPDGLHFAFVSQGRRVACAETMSPSREPITLRDKWSRVEPEVLDLLWLPTDHPDVAVVTTSGVEIFRLQFQHHSARSLKAIQLTVRMCWLEPTAGMALACMGPRTLQPFDLKSKSPRLPRFDLVLGRNEVIEALDVAVMTMYDSTYCIHADRANGRVSLRNISNPTMGTPEHDIVIDVAEDFAGMLRLSKVDNLLVVHCVERRVSMVFDIRHREKAAVPAICGPLPVASQSELAWEGWSCLGGGAILDVPAGKVYRLQLDMGAVLQCFLKRSPPDLATVIKFLLRRSNCRELLVRTLKRALVERTRSDDWSSGFAVLNQAYRQTIESVSHKGTGGRQTTVSLQEIESVIGHQSVLSEKDMVSQVFHPHFLSETGLSAEQSSEGVESWRIPLSVSDESAFASAGSSGSRPVKSPYLLSVVMAYLRSLLSLQILPHKILQCFVFDICMYFQQEHTLQQLLHYHVLVDSPELMERLQAVSLKYNRDWSTQACLDMALRLRKFSTISDMLLHARQYLDIVPFSASQRETSFKLQRLLEAIDADEAARADDPDLLDHVLLEIKAWRQEAAGGTEPPPDLEGCAKWLPE